MVSIGTPNLGTTDQIESVATKSAVLSDSGVTIMTLES